MLKPLKTAILSIATVYALVAIVALWIDKLTSDFFLKFSITIVIIEALLSVYFYFEYWHSDERKNKKDYFADSHKKYKTTNNATKKACNYQLINILTNTDGKIGNSNAKTSTNRHFSLTYMVCQSTPIRCHKSRS